jgi:two-component system sporulation sensor kinase A
VTSADPHHRPLHRESLEVAGVLGAAVAHELRNMLATASSSIFLAKRDVDKRDRLLGHLDAVEAELQRSQDVIERVLRLVRGEPIHRESCRFANIVAEAQRNVLGSSVRIDVEFVPPELEVSCEPLLVERLITNLFANATEALPQGSSGTIVVRVRPDERGFVLEVEDDGPGFDPVVLERLFEPGVTTKSTGTGLGLVLCRAIVRVHGGDMYIERASSGGALVRCVFVQDDVQD